MKFINKILLRCRNYENSRVLPSIRTRSSSRTRTLVWNYLEDYNKNCKNEVNCINDSMDFQDAESERSGNSHVTSQPMLFPKYPFLEGLLRPSFVSPRRKEGLPDIWNTHGISGNVFENPDASSSAPYHPKNCINGIRQSKSRSIRPQWRKVKGQNKIKIRDASLDSPPKILSSSMEETLERIMEQTNNDCRFWIFTLTSSLHQRRLLAGR